jgi:hypothetical protein
MDRLSLLVRIFMISATLSSLTLSAIGCGGGGGGGGTPGAYNGTWQLSGVKVVDQCRTSAASILKDTVYVEHRGSTVTARIGSSSLSGGVTDKDGFDVRGFEDRPNSCRLGIAIEFREASDGTATAVLALAQECNGRTCGLGYAGTATRTSLKYAEISDSSSEFDTISEIDTDLTNSDQAVEGGLESALEETILQAEPS